MDITTVIKLLMLLVSTVLFICFGNSIHYLCTSYDSGEVFGIRIAGGKREIVKTVILGVLLFIFGFEALGTVLYLLLSHFGIFIAYLILFIAVFIISMIHSYKSGIKKCAKDKNALVLGRLDFIQYIDSKIEKSDSFVVGYKDVEVCCKGKREKIYYWDYGYALTSERELALLGMYFLQRHNLQFEMKVKSETVSNYVVQNNIGPSGQYANVVKAKDRIVLHSYIFTRR